MRAPGPGIANTLTAIKEQALLFWIGLAVYLPFKLVKRERDNHTVPLVSAQANEQGASELGQFATTRWSLILSAANSEGEDQKAREALDELCRTYWRPIFSFVCRRGYSMEDAQDLTQDFFAMILERGWLQHADPNRGRFRSLLLKSLQNFLVNAAERTHTRKRGGDVGFVSWDDWLSEAPSQLSISADALDSLPPERFFDLRWAVTVVEQALRRLREECESKGKRRLFQALSCYLTAERDEVSYANLATALGIAESAVGKHRCYCPATWRQRSWRVGTDPSRLSSLFAAAMGIRCAVCHD